MIDPATIDASSLDAFDESELLDVDVYDDEEPLVLRGIRLEAADLATIIEIPFALDGCVVKGCDLSVARVRGIKHSRIEDSKLRTAVFANYVTNAMFGRCQLTECMFRMMKVEATVFADCQLVSCDFYGSEISGVAFPKSRFEGVGFDACTVDDVDFTEATSLLIGDPRTLVGATLCETQLPLIAERLAQLIGINVADC